MPTPDTKEPRSADENWEFLGRDSGPGAWKKGKVGEKIHPMPETQYDIFHENEFPMKIQDEVIEYERIMTNPFFVRQKLEDWGNGNLIVNKNHKLTYFNGDQFHIPINFYKGGERKKEDKFSPYKNTDYTEGSGLFFTTNLDAAHVAPNNTIPILEDVVPTELQVVKSQRQDPDTPSVVQVHAAPKKGLNLVKFNTNVTYVRDSKDYEKIVSATKKVIENNDKKLNKEQKGLTLIDFNRKLLEVGTNAEDFMLRETNMTEEGRMFLSNDPHNLLPGETSENPEESWRWKFRHPDRRGEVSIEDIVAFLPSSDFSDVAKAAGYTGAIIQYHPTSPFMEELPYDPDSFYELLLYV